MKRALGWSTTDLPEVDCPAFDAFRRMLNAKALSVVFASHYLNNPASAFGHIMLYLGSTDGDDAVLADYSVGFEADIKGLAPIGYIPRGLAGGLIAKYTVVPLYERVRKYERHEQRDMWLFPLQVSQVELDQIVRHLWELKDVTFQYGFFGGNCAQKILTLVHAVAPRHRLLPFRGVAVLPSDVVTRLVQHVGLRDKPIYRPSLWSRYSRQVANLNTSERKQLAAMLASRTVASDASPATLWAALLWSEVETPYRAFRRASDTARHRDLVWRRALWLAAVKSDNAGVDAFVLSERSSGPSLLDSHGPSRVTLRGGYRKGSGAMVGAGARWLLHEPLDPHSGYPPVSSLEIARIDLGVTRSGRFFLDEATAVRIEKLAPSSSLQSSLAWKVEAGARRIPHRGASSLHIGTEVGVGAGAAILRRDYSLAGYTMIGVRPGAQTSETGTDFLFAGIWSGGVLLRLPADIRTRVSGEYCLSLTSLEGGTAALNVAVRKGLAKNWDLEVAASLNHGSLGATLGLVMFN